MIQEDQSGIFHENNLFGLKVKPFREFADTAQLSVMVIGDRTVSASE